LLDALPSIWSIINTIGLPFHYCVIPQIAHTLFYSFKISCLKIIGLYEADIISGAPSIIF
jgi:hypothetical protein